MSQVDEEVKNKLEERLTINMIKQIDNIKDKLGVWPSSIEVELVDITDIFDSEKRYAVKRVHIKIDDDVICTNCTMCTVKEVEQ